MKRAQVKVAAWSAAALAAVGATAGWGSLSAPPAEQVLVSAANLPAGHRLVASDLLVGYIPVPAGKGAVLLPAALRGLVPGEVLIRPVLAGAPMLTYDVQRFRRHFRPPPNQPTGTNCVPAKAI